jgi:iron complex outermembrane receptor protein
MPQRRCPIALQSLFALCTLLPATLNAQVADTARVRLDSLQVSVMRSTQDLSRAPFAVSTVGRTHIQDGRLTVGLDEALAVVPGVIVNNRQNFSLGSRITIRGLGARAAFGVRGVRVITDGIPLTMPDGQSNLNNVDLGSAGAIQVLRGPASALHGNAAGGVISIVTESAPQLFSGEGRITVSDAGRDELNRLMKLQVKVGQTLGALDYIASVSRMETDGFRDFSSAEQTVLNTRIGYTASNATRIALTFNIADAPVAQNPGSLPRDSMALRPSMAWPRNVATGAGESARQSQLGLRALHQGAAIHADVSVYGLTRSLENPLPFAYIMLDRRAGGVRAVVEKRSDTFGLSGGIDAEAQRDERREFANTAGEPTGTARRDQIDRVASIAPFAQARVRAGAAGFTLGARYDVFRFETEDLRGVTPDQSGDRSMSAPSAMLGITYDASPATFFANLGTAFQTPTTTELLNAPPAAGQPCCPVGFNEQLDPQRALSAEIGARMTVAGTALDAALYWMDVKDALIAFQVPDGDGREFFRNAGRTRHRGLELSAARRLHALDLGASYTYTDVRFEDDGVATQSFEDNHVPGIPPHHVFASVSGNFSVARATLEVQHHAAQFTDDANTAEADAYTLLALRTQGTIRARGFSVSPWVAVENLLDEDYAGSVTVNAAAARFYEPAPGRTLQLGLTVRTGAWSNR